MSRPLTLRERALLDNICLNDAAVGSVCYSPPVERPAPPLWRDMLEIAAAVALSASVVFGGAAYDALIDLAMDALWPIDTTILAWMI